MKKLLSFILLLTFAINMISCSQQTTAHQHSFSKATCLKPATCTECGETEGKKGDHDSKNGKCSVCGLDYYEELVHLIKTYGCKTDDCYEYKSTIPSIGSDAIYIRFLDSTEKCTIDIFKYNDPSDLYNQDSFYLLMPQYSVSMQKYEWKFYKNYGFSSMRSDRISGQIYASSFAVETTALAYNNSTFTYSSDATTCAVQASDMLKNSLDVLAELLAKSEHNLTPAHYGFKNFG
ncbi:MAG: hypothetical protein E7603_06865 [Ruminococcaceae bacterium]|nr:hypothetical protein [Oscillospiraceae bacterium]